MFHKKYMNWINKRKFFKVFGWVFLISGILTSLAVVPEYVEWKSKEDNYTKQYVLSNNGLYYEKDNEKVYVNEVYDTDENKIELTVPELKTITMYCSKDNGSKCIYMDANDSLYNPFMSLIVILFLFSAGIFFLLTTYSKKYSLESTYTPTTNIYLSYITLLMFSIVLLAPQVKNIVNYMNFKNENTITTATIYSAIYHVGSEENRYKPVAYYYVNNKKYIYIGDTYEEGTFEENLGRTFEVYYNKNNPNEVVKKDNPVNIFVLVTGIILFVCMIPPVFFKKKMEMKLNKTINEEQQASVS